MKRVRPIIRKVIRPSDNITKSGFNITEMERLRDLAESHRKKNGKKLSKEERRFYVLSGKLPGQSIR